MDFLLDIGVVDVVRELSDHFDVLIVSVVSKSLFALDVVALSHCVGVEVGRGGGLGVLRVGGVRHGSSFSFGLK